mmetsp:Transcript_33729/g.77903  ORF Transcript_33729/g.77903 Transcript_33729/m.77903 type:complete len:111 (-) Transcript_33729:678-1010(-)
MILTNHLNTSPGRSFPQRTFKSIERVNVKLRINAHKLAHGLQETLGEFGKRVGGNVVALRTYLLKRSSSATCTGVWERATRFQVDQAKRFDIELRYADKLHAPKAVSGNL